MMTVGDEVLTLRREVSLLRREVTEARADVAALLAETRRAQRRLADHDKALGKTAACLEWLLVLYAGKQQAERGQWLLEVDAVRALAVEETEEEDA